MSKISADTVEAKTTNGDLVLQGNGTGVPNLQTGTKLNGTALETVISNELDSLRTGLMLNTFDDLVDHGRTLVSSPVIIADEFEDALGIDAANSTGETYNAAGYVSNLGDVTTPSAAAEWAGNTGEYTFPGDDIEVAANDNGIYSNDTFAGDFSFTFTYKTDELTISVVGIFRAADVGSFNTGSPAQSFAGWYWSNHTSSNYLVDYASGAATIYNTVAFDMTASVADGSVVTFQRVGTTLSVKVNGATVHTFATTSSDPLKIWLGQAMGSTGHFLDVSWAIPGTPPALDVRSVGVTMASAPTSGFFVGKFSQSDPDTVYASNDGGTTWDTVTLTDYGDFASGVSVFAGPVTLTGGGTDVRLRATKASGTECRVEAWSGVFG